jgi:hypothetical protein
MADISDDDRLMPDDDPRHWTPRASDGKVFCCVTLGWVMPDVAADHRWETSRSPDEIGEARHVRARP